MKINKNFIIWPLIAIIWATLSYYMDSTELDHPWWVFFIGFLMAGYGIIWNLLRLLMNLIFDNIIVGRDNEDFEIFFTVIGFVILNYWWFCELLK